MSAIENTTKISARWRIVGWIVLVTALALLAVTATMRSLLMSQVAENANGEILQEINEFRTFATDGIDPDTGEPFVSTQALVERFLSLQTPSTGEAIIGVVGDQVLFTDNTRGDAGELLANDRSRLDVILQNSDYSGSVMTDQGELRWGRVDVNSSAPEGSSASVIVAHFTNFASERVNQEAVLLFGVAIGGLFVTAGIAWLVSGRILQPLRRMSEVASSITAHDLSARLPVVNRDDISALAVTLNQMLDRVERAYASQRHFVAEAQVHLSAPLRRALAAIEEVARADSPEQRQLAAVRAQTQLGQMRDTLGNLDILALSETPDFLQPTWIPLKEITADIYAGALRDYPDRRIDLEATANGYGWLDGSRLLDAMRQLLDNAVTHSPVDEAIRVGCAIDGDLGRFWVTNNGPQLNDEQAEAIFEVYRTEDDADTGMGLGLAVVRAVADAHGGSAWVESGSQCTRFGLDLPLTFLAPEPDDAEE